jgi:hypothetical protein
MSIVQVFSPAKVIFAGMGVLLLVSTIFVFHRLCLILSLGGQGHRCQSRCARRSVRAYRAILQTSRVLH